MKIYIKKIQKLMSKNIEFFLLFLLIVIAGASTQIYNFNKEKTVENFIALSNNIYFQKTLEHIFNNLEPKYKNITHKVSRGESFNSILKKYGASDKEIRKINTTFLKFKNKNKLKINQVIKFTIEQSENKKITYLLYPISKTKKIEITRDIKNDVFKRFLRVHPIQKVIQNPTQPPGR